METIELAPGFKISRILTGLWQIADMERTTGELDANETAKLLEPYIQNGFTTFDMADHYGSAEIIAGRLQKRADQKLQLFTKWVPKPGKITREDVEQAVDTALERMVTDSIDLLQYHAWNYPDPAWLDGLFYLEELREKGKIKYLGLTNFDTAHLRIVRCSGIRVVSNQVCYSLIDRRASGPMTDLCMKYGVRILAFGTLAGGFLTDKWLGKAEPSENNLKTWSEMKYKRFIDTAGGWDPFQNLLQVLHEVAEEQNASMANISTRFILEQPAVGGVIVGARPGISSHLEDNQKVFDISLSPDQKAKIREAQEQMDPIPGDCGDEYRTPPFLTASGDLSHHVENFPKPFQPQEVSKGRRKILSGTTWEDMAGYSRAVRIGNRISVSGTTATHGSRKIGGSDPEAQAHYILDKIEGAIVSLGGKLEDVIRTRIFVKHIDDWEAAARAHGLKFRKIQPANTLVEADLVGEGYLVEIEAEALLQDD